MARLRNAEELELNLVLRLILRVGVIGIPGYGRHVDPEIFAQKRHALSVAHLGVLFILDVIARRLGRHAEPNVKELTLQGHVIDEHALLDDALGNIPLDIVIGDAPIALIVKVARVRLLDILPAVILTEAPEHLVVGVLGDVRVKRTTVQFAEPNLNLTTRPGVCADNLRPAIEKGVHCVSTWSVNAGRL